MDKWRLLVPLILAILALTALLTMYTIRQTDSPADGDGEDGLLIVVSFPNLKNEVSQLLCSDDKIYVISSSSIDPHEYQLTIDDIEHVKKADLVITLGHAPFEIKLRSLVGKDKLLEIPSIKGMRLFINPDTGVVNPHMIIYDPHNYVLFLKDVAARLAALRPSCSSHYLGQALMLEAEVEELINNAPRVHVKAVASLPYIQYAVNWLGIDVVKLLSKEHGVPVSPDDIEQVRKLMENKLIAVAAIAVLNDNPATRTDARLLELAKEYDMPVLRVPSPYAPGTILEKMKQLVEEIKVLAKILQTK